MYPAILTADSGMPWLMVLGRLLQKRQARLNLGSIAGQHTVAYQYHAGGGLAAVGYPSGLRVLYQRDAVGLIASLDVVLS